MALARERVVIAMLQENDMQPRSIPDRSIPGTAPGFRVLDQDAATAVVRQRAPLPFAGLSGAWDVIVRRADHTIDIELYRRRIAARRRQAAREQAALTSAAVGVLAMTAIYVALFFAAHTRATNDLKPPAPVVAIPITPDVMF